MTYEHKNIWCGKLPKLHTNLKAFKQKIHSFGYVNIKLFLHEKIQ